MCASSGDCRCNCRNCRFGIHRCGHRKKCHKQCSLPRHPRIWGSGKLVCIQGRAVLSQESRVYGYL
jgi:hypothetical protein